MTSSRGISSSKLRQAGVTLHHMAKIRLQEQRDAAALAHVQEAISMFKDTGSRHLPEAETTLQNIQAEKTKSGAFNAPQQEEEYMYAYSRY